MHVMPRWFALLWMLIACAGALHAEGKEMAAMASPKDVMDVLNDQEVIKPGDKVGLRILESGRPPVECVVAKDGTIKVRDLGRIQARGLTCKKLAHLISQKLAALPPASLSYSYRSAPTVAVAFEVIQTPVVKMPPAVPPALR